MDRELLMTEVREVLYRTGFYVSEKNWSRGLSFDLAARRDAELLLTKVLLNVDALSEACALELRSIGLSLSASTLLVGVKSSAGRLEEGVVYSRFGIPIASPETLKEYLEEGVPPFIFSAPGGLYVKLDTDLLRRAREVFGLSLGQLAEVAHVSRRTIQMYLKGMSATVEVALRLEEFLREPLVQPLDPFSSQRDYEMSRGGSPGLHGFKAQIMRLLRELGYEVFLTQKSPFDAITKDQEVLFLAGMGRSEKDLDRKAEVVFNLSKVVERDPVMFVEGRRARNILSGIPIIDSRELGKLQGREEMVELVEERRE
ncbi:MAG: transcriptional regulator [Thermoplasmata archaeon]